MENNDLIEELRRYCRMTRMLHKSLQDTRKTFKDINAAKCMIENQVITANITSVEDGAVQSVASQSPCVVILGQSTRLSVEVTNWIFGCDILPNPGTKPWRTVTFCYGQRNRIADSDISKTPSSHIRSWKTQIALTDIEVTDSDLDSCSVDVRVNLPLLTSGARVAVVGHHGNDLIESYNRCIADVVPIVMYAFQGDTLSEEELKLLHHIHKTDSCLPIYFVRMSTPCADQPLHRDSSRSVICRNGTSSPQLCRQLAEFFNDVSNPPSRPPSDSEQSLSGTIDVSPEPGPVVVNFQNSPEADRDTADAGDAGVMPNITAKNVELMNFADVVGQPNSTDSTTQMDTPPTSADCELSAMVSRAVDRPVCDVDSESWLATTDSEIVDGLFDGFSNGLAIFVRNVLQNRLLSTVALLHAVHKRSLELMITTAYDMQWDTMCTPTRLKFAREKEAELYQALIRVALKKQDEIRKIIIDTVANESANIIESAAAFNLIGDVTTENTGSAEALRNVRECTSQIHEFVLAKLNAAISHKLLQLVHVLNESYTGVLTRCLTSLEQKDSDGLRSTDTSDALKEILTAAYHVEITVCTGASFVKTLIEKMKQLVHGSLWRTPSSLDATWKRKTASNVLATLTEARCQRLAKSICAQIKERVRSSHTCFQTSLQRLEAHHNGRLKQTEVQSLNVRKNYAPRVARLALESRSLRDLIIYGKPEMGREIGRGQYGVVYSCESWAAFGRCAVKSVAPPDERHWNDLAMEFHYTTNIPEHCRIVSLRGSIIDYSYGSGRTPAVLLIMDRYKYDLYTAIERRMNWLSRLQVSVDVVEGIRYLHAQGLVHRDIKLKNVLLDDDNRGRLTDLGFCKPEAMMSGSIVGTPLHMAPELVTGRYDHSVDVYAFGVLFWYVCAGSVRLPSHFEVCANKEMLFTLVQQGLRPEQPRDCDTECWELMQRCWNGEPLKRPHVGELENCLRTVFDRFVAAQQANGDVFDSYNNAELATVDSDGFFEVDYDDLTLK